MYGLVIVALWKGGARQQGYTIFGSLAKARRYSTHARCCCDRHAAHLALSKALHQLTGHRSRGGIYFWSLYWLQDGKLPCFAIGVLGSSGE